MLGSFTILSGVKLDILDRIDHQHRPLAYARTRGGEKKILNSHQE